MNKTLYRFFTGLLLLVCLSAWAQPYYVDPINTIYIQSDHSDRYSNITQKLNYFGIPFIETSSIVPSDDRIYILFNVNDLQEEFLPKNFILCQTQNLAESPLTSSSLRKLSKAIAVWDYSWTNISTYKDAVPHYYVLGEDPASADPAILPLFLPLNALNYYKEVLQYANTHPSDISQHLPAIYCHTVFSHPKTVIEAGVRGGESTVPLHKASNLFSANLIGLDIDRGSGEVYARLHDPILSFYVIDDIKFCEEANHYLWGRKIDVLFIDTSHEYEHTKNEIAKFTPLLAENGIIIFHDSNWSPGLSGVTRALKECFIGFDETKYHNIVFSKNNTSWQMIQYPNCNGLCILKRNRK